MATTNEAKKLERLKEGAAKGEPGSRLRACRRLLALGSRRPRDYARTQLRALAESADADVSEKAVKLLKQSAPTHNQASGAEKIAQRPSNRPDGGNSAGAGEVGDEIRRLAPGPMLRALYERDNARPGFADKMRPALEAMQPDRDAAYAEIVAALDGKPSTLENVTAIEAGLSDGAKQLVAEFKHDLAWAEAVKHDPPVCPYCAGPVRFLPGFQVWECRTCPESRCHWFPKEPRPDSGRAKSLAGQKGAGGQSAQGRQVNPAP